MKLSTFYSALIIVLIVTFLPGCEIIGDIFKAGVWVGVLMVAAVIAVIIFIISKLSGRK
ncbi:MAG: phosphatidate cytidylyltransferase [Sphingobacteriales bacterium JAD_PAG50586_3]|nr:MAG: phosphatidate cytidylyltransferase [Sphingobacteriales bacterium JAD_PAG50586_3]